MLEKHLLGAACRFLCDQDSNRGFRHPAGTTAQLAPCLPERLRLQTGKPALGFTRLQSPLILSTGISKTGKGLMGPGSTVSADRLQRGGHFPVCSLTTMPCWELQLPARPRAPSSWQSVWLMGEDEQKAEGWMDECRKELTVRCSGKLEY